MWAVQGRGTQRGPTATNGRRRVGARDPSGNASSADSDAGFAIVPSGVLASPLAPPTEFALAPVSPNPATERARISFAVPRTSRVRITLIDVQGRTVGRLADGDYAPGRYDLVWRNHGAAAGTLPGVYFVRFEAAGHVF